MKRWQLVPRYSHLDDDKNRSCYHPMTPLVAEMPRIDLQQAIQR